MKQLRKIICIFTTFLIFLPSFNLFGFISIQNTNNPRGNIENIQNSKLEENNIENELIQGLDIILFDKNIQMNFGTASNSHVESDILLYKLGLLFSLVLVNIGVILKKIDGKSRKEQEIHEDNHKLSLSAEIDQEALVLDGIQEYLQNNRYLEVDKIINYLNSKYAKSGINLSNLGIEVIIKSLLDKKFIVEGSKLTRGNVLENLNRNLIFEYIKEKPGAHLMKIVKELNISNFLVRWHLDMLLKFDYIKGEKINNHKIYYDSSINSEEARFNHLVMKEKRSRILDYLEINNKGSTKYQLVKELGMHYNTISKYMAELDEHGIVFKIEHNNKVLYFLND